MDSVKSHTPWRQIFFIGLGFMSISIIWLIYNLAIPIYLQLGHPDFDTGNLEMSIPAGFGFNALIAGLIMSLDNLAALVILPLVGYYSDHTWTRIGRRKPYILAGVPFAAIAFIGLPFTINAESANFMWFFIALAITLTGMAVIRTPIVSLMPDVVAPAARGQANGAIDFLGGVGGVIATLVIVPLFAINGWMPFVISAVILIVTTVLLMFGVREPEKNTPQEDTLQGKKFSIRQLPGQLSPIRLRSLLLMMGALFMIFIGFGAIETFFSSYAVTWLGVSIEEASLLFAILLITFILFSVPAGYIGNAIGRREAIILGLIFLIISCGFSYSTQILTLIRIALVIGGTGFALVSTNTLPIVLDIDPTDVAGGTYVGLYYLATQSAAVVSPIINGGFIALLGGDTRVIFIIAGVSYVFAILCTIFVARDATLQQKPSSL